MGRASHSLFVLVMLAALLAASCGSGSSSPDANCINGDCVTVAVTGPIRLNQPVSVTVTIKTKDDRPEAAAALDVSDPGVIKIEGQRNWRVSARAGQSYSFATQVRFTQPGYFLLIGILFVRPYSRQQSSISVHITEQGGEVEPPGATSAPPFYTRPAPAPPNPSTSPGAPTLTLTPVTPNPSLSPSPFVSPLANPPLSPNPLHSPLATPASSPAAGMPAATPTWLPLGVPLVTPTSKPSSP